MVRRGWNRQAGSGVELTCVGLVLLATFGCSRRDESAPAAEVAAVAPSDATSETALPGGPGPDATSRPADWLREVRRVHETIDHASDAATRESALERMSELWASVPPSWAARPEAVELRQELAARAARLELAAGRPREARRWAERGLALDQDVSSLSAALWLVMADAYEAEGNTSEARGALKEALASHERLLERELEDP